MSLIALRDAHLALGDRPLLDGARLSLLSGERLGLIGRNGTGKSTLLRIIADQASLDEGERQVRDGLKIALVEQEPELPAAHTLRASLLERARAGLQGFASGALLDDERERWRFETRLTEFLHRFELDPQMAPTTGSGGERKRAALALALAARPDLLLLDEPTNHLDIGAIERLEELLLRMPAAVVVTHDRAFLDRVTTRIVELDRGVLRSYPGNFAAYETAREQELAAEEISNRKFDRFWAQEEVWIRKGVEARRTRNEGRVRRLERLRLERAARRERLGAVKISLDAGARSGQLVAELTEVGKSFGGRALVAQLSMRILRGDRIGLIGPNGAGKTTLIRLILDQLPPDEGSVRLGTNLKIAYFDQLRQQLDPEATLADMISPGSEWVEVGGERKHVTSYLGDFLFPAQRARSPVRMLSGGERNRLLLARLFAQPANLLVLDEPTNDLDIESLELLEQRLQDYAGTLLLVSHDRRFLDNIVTQTLAAEGGGSWREYVGGYSDWLRQRSAAPDPDDAGKPPRAATISTPPAQAKPRTRLGYMEQRELTSLPREIEALEEEQATLTASMSTPEYHLRGAPQIRTDRKRLEEIEALLHAKFERWEALEAERSRLVP
ncbi:MAG TPA: ATP-binding cassette domain-containing protein [Steroidobacteraceae bacterium]|jgi:ATP-binding cassette subfamily F protein uup|nr:ATP-binding cassette domain-containing protein [Steroidobacteraceae bacterium]